MIPKENIQTNHTAQPGRHDPSLIIIVNYCYGLVFLLTFKVSGCFYVFFMSFFLTDLFMRKLQKQQSCVCEIILADNIGSKITGLKAERQLVWKFHSKTFKLPTATLQIFTALWLSHTPNLQRGTRVHVCLTDSTSYSGSIVWPRVASSLIWFRWGCGHRYWSYRSRFYNIQNEIQLQKAVHII